MYVPELYTQCSTDVVRDQVMICSGIGCRSCIGTGYSVISMIRCSDGVLLASYVYALDAVMMEWI